MESTNKSSVTLTEKRIASAKTLHVICAIIALVLNVIAFAVLAVNVKITEIMFLAFPLVLAVLDIVFFVKVIFSNYRFKYAVNGAILQALAVFLVSVIAFFVMGFLETKNGKVFVDFAMYAMLIVHILQSVATLLTALYATKGMKSFPKVLCVLFTVAFIGGAAIYGRLLLADGFFGQGGYAEYRTIVYSYDAATDSYTAVDVLDGYGNNVVIPHQFNGSHVLKIDCALFAHEEISSVKIAWADNDGCDKQLDFVGVEHLNYINPELELIAPKLYINHLRKELYALSLDNNNTYALDLANHVYPDGINGNEVYISFGYDKETLELIGVENVIDLWVKDKGTELDLKAHTGVEYIQKSNALNTEHLYWCHENLGEQIFKCIVDADGNEISGEITESIVNAKVVFENLYHIVIEKDNEDADKTPIENTHKYMYTAGSNTPVCEYIITTAANVQSNLDKLPKRNGFTLKLATGDNKHEITDIAEELANLDSKGSNILTVYPVWTLPPPTINNLTADGKTSGHSAVYGSNVVLDSAATSPASDVSIKYEWRYNGQLVASGSKYTLENLYPNDAEFASKNRAGTYTLTVIAGQDGTTALKSEASQTIEVGFEKKELGFNWVIPNDLVYSASDKPINVSYKDEAQIINRDNITYQLSHSALRNAGTYTVRIELTDTSEKLYKIPASDVNTSVTVTPYPINVDWGSDVSFVYNSENQAPTASIQGLGEDGVISLDVFVFDGGKRVQKKNAGKYTATADTDNTNYKLDGNEIAFEITQRPITVTGWNENTFVYTSFAQRPAVTLLGNVAANDPAETVIG